MKEKLNLCLKNHCSACCSDAQIPLTDKELSFLEESGSNLRLRYPILGAWEIGNLGLQRTADGRRIYEMNGRCGYLDNQGLCSVYLDNRRPQTCEDTKPGDYGCQSIRDERGLNRIIPIDEL